MSNYIVIIRRTEQIMFSVEADSAQDAEARYLYEGDETASATVELVVESVVEATDE